jgi:uncharacterized protein DUF222/HNH endonuclease
LHRLRTRLDAQVARRLAAFDASREWELDGKRSAASWIAHAWRASTAAAQLEVKTARQAGEMPLVAQAWQTATIGTEHVVALARTRHAARADDAFAEMEAAMVAVAKEGSPEDVIDVGRQWRDALDADRQDMESIASRQYDSRGLDLADLDGGLVFGGRADGEAGGYIRKAIAAEYEKQHKEADPRTHSQQQIDALTVICMKYLDGLPPGSNLPYVLFLSDFETLDGEAVGLCETDRGVRVSPDTLRRVTCDSFVSSALVDSTSAVLDLGRARRTFTTEQRRAIIVQYPTCVGPGCRVPASECRMHHIAWWEQGGTTDTTNGVPLCWHDHHLVHEKHWRIERDPDTGIIEWFKPDGTPAGTVKPRARPRPIPRRIPKELRDAVQARVEELIRIRDARPTTAHGP